MAITSAQKVPSQGMSLRPPAAVSGNPRSVTAPVGPLQSGGTPVLTTYETAQRMADLWLVSAISEQSSLDHMDRLCAAALRRYSKHYSALNIARCAVQRGLRDTVFVIRDRGCLLHLNAPAFGGNK